MSLDDGKAKLLLREGKALALLAGSCVKDPTLDQILLSYAKDEISEAEAFLLALNHIKGKSHEN